MNSQKLNKIQIAILLGGGIIFGWCLGYLHGSGNTLNWCVDMGFRVWELSNSTINLDPSIIYEGVNYYQHQIPNFLSLK